MPYIGDERRKVVEPVLPVLPVHCIHENEWGRMTAAVENLDRRINGSLHEMEKHMDSGKGWRAALLGVIVAIFLQIVGFSYLWGGMTSMVSSHEKKISTMETIDLEAQKIRATNVAKIANLEKMVNRESSKV
jgi:hypothetical protein